MANNTIQIKRTSVSGRAANTTTIANAGELALNMTDGIMYSTNGSSVFEVGANLANINVRGGIKANGSFGSAGQILTSNGTTSYWANTSSGVNAQQNIFTYTLAANTSVIQGADDVALTLSYTAGLESVFINGVRQISGVDYNTTNSAAIALVDSARAGEVVQVVTWAGAVNSVNVAAQYVWTNTHTFNSLLTVNNSLYIASGGDLIISPALGGSNTTLYNDQADLYIYVNNAVRGYFASNGNFGLGNTTPAQKLVVEGNTTITGYVNATSSVNSAVLSVGTNFVANSTQTTLNSNMFINNNKNLNFQTVNTSASVYFKQQNDDNFVFATTNTAYGARSVFSIYANSVTSNLNILVPLQVSSGLVANSTKGSAYQTLHSNSTGIYWEDPFLRSSGQQVFTATSTLGADNYGSNILVVTGGITITLPSGSSIPSGMGITIKNVSGANITISYAYAGDGQTNLQNNQSATWFGDGGGGTFWRQYFLSTNA